MHFGDQLWNWIVQIKFGFKPKSGITFGFNFGFSGSIQFKTLLKTRFNRHLKFSINYVL